MELSRFYHARFLGFQFARDPGIENSLLPQADFSALIRPFLDALLEVSQRSVLRGRHYGSK